MNLYLESIIENSKKINCLLIEFHGIAKNIEKIRNFIKDNKLLKLIHIHGNNYFGLDNDGLPEWWEMEFDLDPFDASEALLDSDGDGHDKNRNGFLEEEEFFTNYLFIRMFVVFFHIRENFF